MKKQIEFQLQLKLLPKILMKILEKKYKVGEIYEGVLLKLWIMVALLKLKMD